MRWPFALVWTSTLKALVADKNSAERDCTAAKTKATEIVEVNKLLTKANLALRKIVGVVTQRQRLRVSVLDLKRAAPEIHLETDETSRDERLIVRAIYPSTGEQPSAQSALVAGHDNKAGPDL